MADWRRLGRRRLAEQVHVEPGRGRRPRSPAGAARAAWAERPAPSGPTRHLRVGDSAARTAWGSSRRTCYASGVRSTRVSRRVNAPRAAVYRALLDARAVATWMVPQGMTSHVHAFDPREGGAFRISLTYGAPLGTGKTTAHTDTYHGRFVQLVPDERVVEVVEFETADPALRGEMTITIALADAADADGGTVVHAVHDGLPPGLSAADNEAGWRSSLAKLAALVEAG